MIFSCFLDKHKKGKLNSRNEFTFYLKKHSVHLHQVK